MQGSIDKRCPCPLRRDARGRRVPCGKAHGSWSYKVDLPSDDGGRRQLGKGGFTTKRDAEQALAERLTNAARGPVGSLVSASVTPHPLARGDQPSLSPAVWINYQTCVDRYGWKWLSGVPLGQLTGSTLTRHNALLLERGGYKGRPLSPTTVRTVHRVLSEALGDAVRDELLEHNPISRAFPPTRRRYEARVWTAEEAVRFLTAVQSDRLYAAWLVALSCGLRRGELAGLRWRDLDLERGTLSVTTQRTTTPTISHLRGDKGSPHRGAEGHRPAKPRARALPPARALPRKRGRCRERRGRCRERGVDDRLSTRRSSRRPAVPTSHHGVPEATERSAAAGFQARP